MSTEKPKRIALTIEKMVSLSCSNCGERIDNPNNAIGFILKDEWASLPEQIRCEACGTTLIIPKQLNPFK